MRQVDLLARTIRLEVGETKNDEGRTVVMTDEVYTLLAACVAHKHPEHYVFSRESGDRIRDFRKTWKIVCERAGVPDLLLHDLRRTGVRNLRRLGVAESVAMKISGHKIPSVFRRYDITDEADLADAAERLNAKRTKARNDALAEFGHSSGIVSTNNGAVASRSEMN